jgi:hypothetical protein
VHCRIIHSSVDLVDLAVFSLRGRTSSMVVPDVYNESLVRRSEIVLDFDVIGSWNDELNKMNDGKEAVSYKYPDSFVQLLRSRVNWDRRSNSAYAGEKAPSVPDYSTVH